MELSPVLTMIFGALLIGIGGHLSAITPKLWQGMIIKSNPRILAVILGLLGIALVGGGGALTTYAWNEFDHADEKEAIIISVSKELEHNAYLFRESNLFSSDAILLEGLDFYPRFQNDAMQYALVSELFDVSDSLEKEWLSDLRATAFIVYDMNSRLQVIDDIRIRITDKEELAKKKQEVNDSEMLQDFMDGHNRMVESLKSIYPWVLTGSVEILLTQN